MWKLTYEKSADLIQAKKTREQCCREKDVLKLRGQRVVQEKKKKKIGLQPACR